MRDDAGERALLRGHVARVSRAPTYDALITPKKEGQQHSLFGLISGKKGGGGGEASLLISAVEQLHTHVAGRPSSAYVRA